MAETITSEKLQIAETIMRGVMDWNAVKTYADWRISAIHAEIELTDDTQAIFKAKGQIAELRRLQKLEDRLRGIIESRGKDGTP